MNFMEKMGKVLNEEFNESITENGAVGYKTTGKEMVDFNYKISSYRNKTEREIIDDWDKVWLDDSNKILAMKFLFFIRDREEGLGERRLFRIIIKHLANTEPTLVQKVAPIIAEYGRWDDLFELFDTELEDYVIDQIIGKQLLEDTDNYLKKKPISLLAKWMPSINASSVKTREKAKKIIRTMTNFPENQRQKMYRQALSKLRQYIDVTERKMCANEWDKIKYENVPSRANLNYNDAFLRHDEERRREFLEKVEKGEKKINAGKLFPHDIVHKYMSTNKWGYSHEVKNIDATLEELWKALPQKEIENTLVVADGSGSMTCTIGKTNVSALDVANALAIYFAEHNKGEFKDKYITFSSRPQYVDFKGCTSLRDKIKEALLHDECSNTDIRKVFDLILDTGVSNKLAQDEMPANILIISDMEFDGCVIGGKSKVLFKQIEEEYKQAGYKLPKLIFWNVNSRTCTIPIKENDRGVILVSGYTPIIADMIMSTEVDPYGVLLKKINTPRYDKIAEVLA